MRTRLGLLLAAPIALAIACAVAGAATPAKGGHYHGRETGCDGLCASVDISVSRNAKKLSLTVNDWSATCRSVDSELGFGNYDWDGSTDGSDVKVRGGGRFSVSGTYTTRAPRTYGGPATKGEIHMSVTGTFVSSRKANVTAKIKVTGKDAAGHVVDTCSIKDTFVAKH
jgi:hypothetical protein